MKKLTILTAVLSIFLFSISALYAEPIVTTHGYIETIGGTGTNGSFFRTEIQIGMDISLADNISVGLETKTSTDSHSNANYRQAYMVIGGYHPQPKNEPSFQLAFFEPQLEIPQNLRYQLFVVKPQANSGIAERNSSQQELHEMIFSSLKDEYLTKKIS